ncbi:hypothetical protein SAMN05444920_10440 [Nonomuraea solani]|uniref:Uncharacterized protein n=1 Tax=Nonomuraea solani TaxID=1144553 RepID=A0A1H6CJ71_9ACTN|nr:hypothetical protein SAMN05444920_10440 [Nonomuraea solani]
MPAAQRLLGQPGQIGLLRVRLQQRGTPRRRQPARVLHRRAVVRRRLPVRSLPGRPRPGQPPVPQDGGLVPRVQRVVDQPAGVDPPDPSQDAEHPAVRRHPPRRRQRLLHRAAQQLVPERHPVTGRHQHPRVDTRLDQLRRARHDGRVGAGGHHGHQPGQLSGGPWQRPQPIENQILYGRRHRRALAPEQFGHQQRVTAGQPVDHRRVPPRQARLLAHAVVRQRAQPDALDEGARQGGQRAPDRVLGPHLVIPVRHHQQRGQPADPPPQPDQPVQRGLVGPVRVLHHDHGVGPRRGQLLQGGREDLLLDRAGAQPFGENAPGLEADVMQRPQRPRGDQPVAGTP